jgi:hypothetical protein
MVPADFETRTWEHVRAHAEARIATLRAENDRPQNTEQQTATLRGRILELKDLLALATAPADDAGPA